MTQVYQDRRTGKRVRIVGGMSDKEDFVLVTTDGQAPFYCQVDQLMKIDEAGVPDFASVARPRIEEVEEKAPDPVIPIPETRLNLNVATPEEISKRIPGVGYRIAKRIVDARLALPGERFTTLDQVTAVSSRVNWEEVQRANLMFIG
jgi:hypothetical protein